MPTNGAALTCDRCERALPRTGRDGAPRFRTIPPFPWASFSHDAISWGSFSHDGPVFADSHAKVGDTGPPRFRTIPVLPGKFFARCNFPEAKLTRELLNFPPRTEPIPCPTKVLRDLRTKGTTSTAAATPADTATWRAAAVAFLQPVAKCSAQKNFQLADAYPWLLTRATADQCSLWTEALSSAGLHDLASGLRKRENMFMHIHLLTHLIPSSLIG